MSKDIPKWSLVPTALLAAIVGWTVRPVVNPTEQSIQVEFPGNQGSVTIKSKRSETLPPDTLLARIFATDFGRSGILGILRNSYQIYHLEDARLVDALRERLCAPIPDAPLPERLDKAKACAETPVANALRLLARTHQTPFHYVGEQVRMGVQGDQGHRPGRGRANVCRSGPFVGQRLQVVEPRTLQSVELQAAGVYDCTLPVHPKIQLDPTDAAALFAKPLDEYEEVIVIAL